MAKYPTPAALFSDEADDFCRLRVPRKYKQTRKELFLIKMDRRPWKGLIALIERHYQGKWLPSARHADGDAAVHLMQTGLVTAIRQWTRRVHSVVDTAANVADVTQR